MFGSYRGYPIFTLPSYNTPYFYAMHPSGSAPRVIGSLNHFQTLKRLYNHIDRQIKKGALVDLTAPN